MIEPATLELIQQELDGETSAAESADLRARLEADPGARETRDELALVTATLASLPSFAPPPGLPGAVLARIRESRTATAAPARRMDRPRPRRGAVRLVWAAAAGLAIGLLLSPLVAPRPSEPGSFDWTAATGSMVRPELLLDAKPIATRALEGRATLRGAGDRLALDLDLEATEPITLSLQFDPERLAFEGIHRASGSETPISVHRGELRLEASGPERTTVLLRRLVPGEAALVLAARSGEESAAITLSTEGDSR